MNDASASASALEFRRAREGLVADETLDGLGFMRACSALTDRWLTDVFKTAMREVGGPADGLALVALGGYGRRTLSPGSDLDLLLVHADLPSAAEVADAVWYPVWDSGVKLGHSVRSLSDAVALVASDVESATAMLDLRLLAGDGRIAEDLQAQVTDAWTGSVDQSAQWLRVDAAARLDRFGTVAFSSEPNLKVGQGGLRDAQIPRWLLAGGVDVPAADLAVLSHAQSVLEETRVALHRSSPGAGDVLRSGDLLPVAARIGSHDADDAMTRLVTAARDVAWICDELWGALDTRTAARRHGRLRRPRTRVSLGVEPQGSPGDPVTLLTEVATCATQGQRVGRGLLERFVDDMPVISNPWPANAREPFCTLLACGRGAIPIIESLDHFRLWERLLPEWETVRNRPRREIQDGFTLDRHLLETAAAVAALAQSTQGRDLVVLAGLLHGMGGGAVATIGTIARRIGLDPAEASTVEKLCKHRRLLGDVASRRDVRDPQILDTVAEAVGSVEFLDLLAMLTEADARATGAAAWTPYKADHVATLCRRVALRLQGDTREQYGRMFPSVEQMLQLRAGAQSISGNGHTLSVIAPDRPGLFCRVTGVLVLRGLDVLGAEVTTSDDMALEEFTVKSAFASADLSEIVEIDWDRVVHDIEQAIDGRLAIAARVAERATTYRRRSRAVDTGIHVSFERVNDDATLLEVSAPDEVGLLYRVTRALGDLLVDIRSARVETQSGRVVDVFTIVDADGHQIDEPSYREEIELAVRHAAGA